MIRLLTAYYLAEVKKLDSPQEGYADMYYNLGWLAYLKHDYVNAPTLLKQSIDYAQQYNNQMAESVAYRVWAEVDWAQNRYESATYKATQALEVAKSINNKRDIYRAYETLSKIKASQRSFAQAYAFTQQAKLYKDSLQSQTAKSALQLFEYERKQGEIAILKAQQAAEFERREQQQRWIIFSGLAGLVSLSFFSAFIYQNRKKEQRSAALLRQKNTALTLTQEQLQKKNDDITASIQYARRIQQAMLPAAERISLALSEHFIFFQPRDIVSGDFYWFTEQDDKYIIAAVDCTGHGVPGAFMSMIGSELLNQIVNVQGITSPEIILQQLHKGISAALNQQESANRDGMDMALCTIDFLNRKLEYAGAMNPLYYVQNGAFHEIKADKRPIGGLLKDTTEYRFQKHSIPLTDTPATFYICSDGFQNEFGGVNGRKFMVKNFKNLLHEIADLPMEQQQQRLSSTFNTWKGNEPQVDDVLVVGFRV